MSLWCCSDHEILFRLVRRMRLFMYLILITINHDGISQCKPANGTEVCACLPTTYKLLISRNTYLALSNNYNFVGLEILDGSITSSCMFICCLQVQWNIPSCIASHSGENVHDFVDINVIGVFLMLINNCIGARWSI